MGARPIFVLGPSRSGTSVVTRVINLLGAELCLEPDLYSAPDNPDGHWESKTVIDINERILRAVGATWGLPPSTPCEPDELADEDPGQARARFLAVHPQPGFVCKDPRLSFTLEFWVQALDVDPVVVLVRRAPQQVVRSLTVDGIPKAHAVAMWERYARAAVAVARGRPTAVVDFRSLVDAPEASISALASDLARAGTAAALERVSLAVGAVHPGAARHAAFADLDDDFTGQQAMLWTALTRLPTWSSSFDVDLPGPESPGTNELIEALRRERWLFEQVGRLEAALDRRPSRRWPISLLRRYLVSRRGRRSAAGGSA